MARITGPRAPQAPAPTTGPTASSRSRAADGATGSPARTDRFEASASSRRPTPPHTRPATPAERYMQPLDRGFWTDTNSPPGFEKVQGYVDFAVNNYEFHKKMAVTVRVERDNGVVEEFLYRPKYKGPLPDGKEKWGVDISLYPDAGHHGKIKSVDVAYLVQADTDGDWQRDTTQSKNTYQLATYDQLKNPSLGMGRASISGQNPDFGVHELDTSGARGSSQAFKNTVPPMEVYFAPYDNPERAIIGEIDKVIQTQRDDPQGHHYIHASVFNINDARIVDKLIEAHKAGVEVKLLTAAHQLDPQKHYQTEYKRLQDAGVDLVGVVRDGAFASNHTKFAIFDGKVATTGSYNWETRSAEDNNENLMILRSPEVAAVYEEMFEAIGGGVQSHRAIDPASKLNVYYSQQHDVAKVIHDELEAATKSIDISMFTLRSLKFHDGGQQKDVLDALVRAHQRGVKVNVLLEKNIADAGEYYGRTTDNDLTDEWLSEQGIEVTKIHTNYNNNKYAAMHHKFAVIDGETTLTGPFNWYSGSQVSDDDLIVVRDPTIANRYTGEITNLRRHYDPEFDPSSVPSTAVDFRIHHPFTAPGDTVYLVGNIPELGSWDASKAIALDPEDWPDWKVSVDIPAGTHFEYKLLVKNHWGRFWEPGSNREHTADPDGQRDGIRGNYR